MTQQERLEYLIKYLLAERGDAADIPARSDDAFRLFRALVNVREPLPASDDFLSVQDEFLSQLIAGRGVTDAETLSPSARDERLFLWRGDITSLKIGAIVNAANSALLGCFAPNHACIDNAIHTFSGVQLRLACARLMEEQGHAEATGQAKITPAFNLPSDYVLHTVGPIIRGALSTRDEKLLANCYTSCLNLAAENAISSVAFCCISTGVFHFPNDRAAEIAVASVLHFLDTHAEKIKVVFNVFKEEDYAIYSKLLG